MPVYVGYFPRVSVTPADGLAGAAVAVECRDTTHFVRVGTDTRAFERVPVKAFGAKPFGGVRQDDAATPGAGTRIWHGRTFRRSLVATSY